jgi:SAM-dependent methyltransferase
LDRVLASAAFRATAGPAGRRPRILDFGAGSGLLAALLASRADVVAVDPGDAQHIGAFYPTVRSLDAEAVTAGSIAGFDLVVCSWMEAGRDLRAEVVALAERSGRIFSVDDAEGGTGAQGDVSYAPFGFERASTWRGPSFEDVDEALARRGRGIVPGERNVFAVWARPPEVETLRERIRGAPRAFDPLPWEQEMRDLGWGPADDALEGPGVGFSARPERRPN